MLVELKQNILSDLFLDRLAKLKGGVDALLDTSVTGFFWCINHFCP